MEEFSVYVASNPATKPAAQSRAMLQSSAASIALMMSLAAAFRASIVSLVAFAFTTRYHSNVLLSIEFLTIWLPKRIRLPLRVWYVGHHGVPNRTQFPLLASSLKRHLFHCLRHWLIQIGRAHV